MILEEYKYLVIRIMHKLDSQEKLDLAINRMEALGLTVIDNWDVKRIQEFNKHYANKPQNTNRHFFLTAKTIEVDDSLSITDDDFQILADDCLMWFGDDCLLKLQKEIQMPSPPNLFNDFFYKGKPTCKCGMIVNHQEGITFDYVKEVLERNGFSNIVLNEKNYMWMKIDFEATSLFIPDFAERYLNNSGIKSFQVFGNRASWAYSKKNLSEDTRLNSLKVVPIKRENNFNFSGDDLSLDSRFW